MARTPSDQWKMNRTPTKMGVQGASKNAVGPGPDRKRWMVSRSAAPVAGTVRAWADAPELLSVASRTLGSMRAWKRAPVRARTRERAWSIRPMARNSTATMAVSVTSVASEREVRTRS